MSKLLKRYVDELDRVQLKDALKTAMEISSAGNSLLQHTKFFDVCKASAVCAAIFTPTPPRMAEDDNRRRLAASWWAGHASSATCWLQSSCPTCRARRVRSASRCPVADRAPSLERLMPRACTQLNIPLEELQLADAEFVPR